MEEAADYIEATFSIITFWDFLAVVVIMVLLGWAFIPNRLHDGDNEADI